MDTLFVVMPAYNEEANIREVVTSWYKVLEGKSDKSRLVVADFGSTDSTHSILLEMQKDMPQIEVLEKSGKLHGPKIIALYDYAIKSGADYIFQTDSDGQTNPDEFDEFWQLREQYAGIFGNRTVRGDGQDRAFVEKVVCLLVKLYFKVTVPDANAPFRLMKADVVGKYLYKLPEDYFLPNVMMTAYFEYFHEKTLFKEISFKERIGGENSIDIPKIIKIGFDALGDFRKLKKGLKE